MTTITRNGVEITFDEAKVLRWIEDLESGKWRQAKGQLRKGNLTFCCLGRLADLEDPKGWRRGEDDNGDPAFEWHGIASVLPAEVFPDYGLGKGFGCEGGASADPRHRWFDQFIWLSEANDAGKSFSEIAAELRNYYGLPPREDAAPQ